MVVSFTVVLYTTSSGFSGNTLYDDMALAAYNVAFTSWPVIILGLFEQDTDAAVSLKHPPLYAAGPQDVWLNSSRFTWWVLEGLYAAFAIYAITWRGSQDVASPQWLHQCSGSGILDNGRSLEQAGEGVLLYTGVIFVVTQRVAIETQYWTWIHHVTYWGSVFLWFLFCVIEGSSPIGIVSNGTIYMVFYDLSTRPFFWLIALAAIVVSCLPCYVRKAYMQCYQPRIADAIRSEVIEQERQARRRSVRRERKRASEGLPVAKSDDEVRKHWPQLGFADGSNEPNPLDVLRGSTQLTGSTPRAVGNFMNSFSDADQQCRIAPSSGAFGAPIITNRPTALVRSRTL